MVLNIAHFTERIEISVKIKKVKLLLIISAIILVTGTPVVFATLTTETKSLGLFENVSDDVRLDRYANHINEVSDDTAKLATKGVKLSIRQTIFTDHHAYAIIGLEGSLQDDLNMTGRIVFGDVNQTIYGLEGEFREVEQIDGIYYFFYTGKIAPVRNPLEDKQVIGTAGDRFLKLSSLRDFAGELFELTVDFDGNEHVFTTTVSNVFTKNLVFHPDTNLYTGDFYHTVILTPYELRLEGMSESLLSADEEKWEQPHFHVTIVRKDKPDLHMKYDTRGSISDEGFPLGMSRGHASDTGKFSHYWNFRGWELDLKEVSALIIDGERFRVKK